jgi:hypothetical protein
MLSERNELRGEGITFSSFHELNALRPFSAHKPYFEIAVMLQPCGDIIVGIMYKAIGLAAVRG